MQILLERVASTASKFSNYVFHQSSFAENEFDGARKLHFANISQRASYLRFVFSYCLAPRS